MTLLLWGTGALAGASCALHGLHAPVLLVRVA